MFDNMVRAAFEPEGNPEARSMFSSGGRRPLCRCSDAPRRGACQARYEGRSQRGSRGTTANWRRSAHPRSS